MTTTPETQQPTDQLEKGTYEVIRNRLLNQGIDLQQRIGKLNDARKTIFGTLESKLVATERITTEHNCIPMDMIPVGDFFLFGYNVRFGLKTEIALEDVFSIYKKSEKSFQRCGLELISDARFTEDFKNLYKYFRETRFIKFAQIGPHLFMVFQVGKTVNDVKTFKWTLSPKGEMVYLDNRSDHEFTYPQQYDFSWKRTTREQHREGLHPHISVEDKVFVETIGGDLTIKVEDNTTTGKGIYSEEVELKDQTLDDGEFYYALLENIILLKIRPYKENKYRYLVYNQKLQQVLRINALEDSCILLPEGQGIIFSNGYYLQTGEHKLFEGKQEKMIFEKRIASPNGEDFLFVFFKPEDCSYLLLFYNLIEQKITNSIFCHGYSLFENGELSFFRADTEPQKFHTISTWQTAFTGPNYVWDTQSDSYLYKVGNKEIVKAMADCRALHTLLNKEDSYLNLYIDLSKKASEILDAYHWLDKPDAYELIHPLSTIREAASSAINEFEKVNAIRKTTAKEIEKVTEKFSKLSKVVKLDADNISTFVQHLSELRILRGELISAKKLRYADVKLLHDFEAQTEVLSEDVSQRCVQFLLGEKALSPYEEQVKTLSQSVPALTKTTDADAVEEQAKKLSAELEMLIETVSNLKIKDPTETTRIIDAISAIYAGFNQIRAALKNKRQQLAGEEGKAEFNAQLKLVNQSVINFLDVCDKPEKCDQYLNKLMVMLEEMEGKFAAFDEFVSLITEKREEVYSAFDARKIQLSEAQQKRAASLMASAERILNGVKNRSLSFTEAADVNGYFAADAMISKVRDIASQLKEIGENLKADELEGKLKTLNEDALRQLKDKKEMYIAGGNVIKIGKHQFSVNTQPIDLSIIAKEDKLFFHLSGTKFYEEIKDESLQSAKSLWDQHLVSENNVVYRAEYLAWKIFAQAKGNQTISLAENEKIHISELQKMLSADLLLYVQKCMAPLYNEGYIKGVHDADAAKILEVLVATDAGADLLRYSSQVRASANLYWSFFIAADEKELLKHRLKGIGIILKVFPNTTQFSALIDEIAAGVCAFLDETKLFDADIALEAAEYLFHEISIDDEFIADAQAVQLQNHFLEQLKERLYLKEFEDSLKGLENHPSSGFKLLRKWISAYIVSAENASMHVYTDEAAFLLLNKTTQKDKIHSASLQQEIDGMQGNHHLIQNGKYKFHFHQFNKKLQAFHKESVPAFIEFQHKKKALTDQFRKELRLEEFQPKVLTSFVRNKLLDNAYLPFIGDNLAKQLGTVGDTKLSDRMGMLLLISPPGYGKTTLMEYLCSRLGLVFMKINGPAIGHNVTSVDPKEAGNAAAAEELEKLNLALEMGDNMMLYLDDIQHCNPEFLQKFISLSDAQRKMEGVYKGHTKTYDLKGRKVCVVMAGNPYTESGEKFRIPDMLANRADIYNLGDVVGSMKHFFTLSYIENCLSVNPVLNKLATKSQSDIYEFLKMAEDEKTEGLNFEASYSAAEVEEIVSVLRKLLKIRDVVFRVNQEYIHSAAQAEEYRTEPAFRLQGSYRDMSKIAVKVLAVLNNAELDELLLSHYTNESQTLTSGAEANLLKFKEMVGWMNEKDKQRWEEIKATFVKNNKYKALGESSVNHVIAHMENMTVGINSIAQVLKEIKN